MKKLLFTLLLGTFSAFMAIAQNTLIKGSVLDAVTSSPIPDVSIIIEETEQSATTDALGEFTFSTNVPLGEQVLRVSKIGYLTKRYPIVVNEGQTVDITDMTLEIDVSDQVDLFTITLSDDELNDDTSGADNISGLLQSSRDVFQRTAAFEFSPSFFRVRGLDSENGSILINGIEMNKIYNGRPQWSNWGGLNDVVRNQELTIGLAPSSYNFGGILGTTNINTRATNYREGGQVTYSSSNRSYTNRMMASYSSGLMKGNFAYTIMASRRFGEEGYQDATLYDANSFFVSVEKKINDKHSLNFTSIYAQNRRGKSSPNTQEVYDLKDIRYNEYWGYQDGEKRNSRVKEVEEPIVMLNHFWDISNKTTLNTNLAYQFGSLGNSRLNFTGANLVTTSDGQNVYEGGGRNPSPTYYQKLPSYFERNFPDDLEFAYGAQQEFLNDGQIKWQQMYDANLANAAQGKNSTYILYEDRVDDKQLTLNTILNTELNDNILINASLNYKTLESENFAEIIDLLGGTGYLNVDGFEGTQNDLLNPNRVALQGDRFSYNYNINADVLSGYAQAQFKYNKFDFYLSANVTSTKYQREGLYQNELFKDNSVGKGRELSFSGFGAKGGLTYKITGKHLVDLNAGYITRAPSIRNSYSNSRSNHNIVPNISEEKITALDGSYIFRSPILKAKLTGFYTKIEDANEISFFFTEDIGSVIAATGTQESGDDTGEFIQEILQGIDKKHIGAELGIEAQVTPTIKLKGAASIGQYTYDNDPDLYISSDRFNNFYVGKSFLKDYRIASGPQRAYSVGFEYRDPDYWWVGATTNFFTNTYVDVSPLRRTSNFYSDVDGLPYNDYDESLARELLRQEEFDEYMVVNLIGGKSWKIGDYFVGFFASVGNLLDKEYKTGGFEQGRFSGYRELRDDQALNRPVFGSRYWYGRGTNYFVNLYFRF
ncbi:MAG: TonB-dependent receptor [Flavobacteriaceae bacterium]|nr:TonB-dependent receptor [Bacteroidia bacterium]NNL61828.1 TonB-dependent receptor [Flavobacteriaceae bacterium]